ncbi:MAG: HupE/UreJ family protein [Flammeovirgaceae bacterium]
MSEFFLYFSLGRDHILDYANGYDHILFVLALCSVYVIRDWKKILILVTAFTIGHSITLALATMQIISVDTGLIEWLIPITILITAVNNLFKKVEAVSRDTIQINYVFALFFGLIHGMGFSNYLRAILGKDHSIITQLLAFNLGLEYGQIIVVVLFLIFTYILVDWAKVARRDWNLILSSAIAGIALILIKDRL